MRRAAVTLAALALADASACVDLEDGAELDTESVSQEVISSELLGRAHGFAGNATGGAAGFHYVVTSTADDGSCGTLRYGVGLPGAKWITFDPQVFPAGTKRSIWLTSALAVPSNTTIDGRGSWVSLRRAYDARQVFWRYLVENDAFECDTPPGQGKGPIVDIRSASNVIITNLDFYKTYPLGTVRFDGDDDDDGDGEPYDVDENDDDGYVNLDSLDAGRVDAQCYGDAVAIQFASTEVWIDHSDFTRCGDECISVRAPAETYASEVTISNNYFTNTWKGILLGAYGDMSETNSIRIAASVYQNRFLAVRYRQPRIEAAAAHVYNNLYEDWRGQAVHVHATTSDDILADNPGLVVRSRAIVDNNVFKAVSRTATPMEVVEASEEGEEITVDAVLWSKNNRCSNTSCLVTSSFPSCGSWYFPCDSDFRAGMITFPSTMTFQQAYDRLRPLGGSSRSTANDVRGYAAYSCVPQNAPPF